VSEPSGMLLAMIFSVRVDYQSTMGEVGRVLRAVENALGEQGIVWASSEDTIQGRSDSDFEPAAGYALIDVEAPDRAAAHELVGGAVQAADPDQEVIVGGDLVLTPISTHT
jgi:hypothetical protein